ncbi:MAG: O-antigen ligase family protein [Ignavibacteria bacterium]|nr:O-antigen ligase family protein [Ignavibacteria bacterium]
MTEEGKIKNRIPGYADSLISFFIILQVIAVGFSIALSSIALGAWIILWILKISLLSRTVCFKIMWERYRLFIISVILFFLCDFLARTFAVYREGALTDMKRYLLIIIFFSNQTIIKERSGIFKAVFYILTAFSVVSLYEIGRYLYMLNDLLASKSFSEIRIDYLSYPITNAEVKMLLLLFIFPALISKEKLQIKKFYIVLITLPVLVSVYLTQSRNVYLAIFVSLFIFGLFFNRKFLAALIILTAIFILAAPSTMTKRLTSAFDTEHESNKSRLIMWDVGIKVFKDHPLLGTGENEITRIYKSYKTPEYHGEGSHFHSNYIMILVTMGITGFLIYLAFWFSLFGYLICDFRNYPNNNDRNLILGIILSAISLHVSGIFEWNFGDWEVMTVMYYLISIMFILKSINLNENINGRTKGQ